jgi:hypothetical protein
VSKDNRQTFELYDLVDDPYEKNDISSAFPDLLTAMAKELDLWLNTFE